MPTDNLACRSDPTCLAHYAALMKLGDLLLNGACRLNRHLYQSIVFDYLPQYDISAENSYKDFLYYYMYRTALSSHLFQTHVLVHFIYIVDD